MKDGRENAVHPYVFLLFCGCAQQPAVRSINGPGFFTGIFHGVVLPFSFIGSLLYKVRIYAFPLSGIGYDFGFIIGLLLLSIFLSDGSILRIGKR